MTLEPIGIFAVLLGLFAILRGPETVFIPFAIATLMGSAAAVNLPALGNASILVGHAMLVLLTLAMLPRPAFREAAIASLAFAGAGFLLLLATAYGMLSAAFLPRIFAGATDVYSLARGGEERARIVISTLTPRTTNITQGGYLAMNLACFAFAAAVVRFWGTARMARALVILGAVNLGFAAIDIATFATGTAEILAFVRNANYAILDEYQVAGLKRIVGLHPEASAFAYITIGLFAYTTRLWLGGVWTRLTGSVAFLLGMTLILSTSTTAYASLALLLVFMLGGSALRLFRGAAGKHDLRLLMVVPPVAFTIVLGVMLMPGVWDVAAETMNRTVVGKMDSASGVERSAWNSQGMQAFVDTSGFGAGVGSVRTSSFLVALLANVGIIGTLLFLGFIGAILLAPRMTTPPGPSRVMAEAAAMACLGMVISACISLTSTDLGLLFFLFAALAAAPRKARIATPTPIPGDRISLMPRASLAGYSS